MLGQIPHCTELNASQMPGGCLGGGWAVLELTGTLDAFVNRRAKQKTENTVTFSHFYQYELDISEYNPSHSQC